MTYFWKRARCALCHSERLGTNFLRLLIFPSTITQHKSFQTKDPSLQSSIVVDVLPPYHLKQLSHRQSLEIRLCTKRRGVCGHKIITVNTPPP
jgi:hypothetical protein